MKVGIIGFGYVGSTACLCDYTQGSGKRISAC